MKNKLIDWQDVANTASPYPRTWREVGGYAQTLAAHFVLAALDASVSAMVRRIQDKAVAAALKLDLDRARTWFVSYFGANGVKFTEYGSVKLDANIIGKTLGHTVDDTLVAAERAEAQFAKSAEAFALRKWGLKSCIVEVFRVQLSAVGSAGRARPKLQTEVLVPDSESDS